MSGGGLTSSLRLPRSPGPAQTLHRLRSEGAKTLSPSCEGHTGPWGQPEVSGVGGKGLAGQRVWSTLGGGEGGLVHTIAGLSILRHPSGREEAEGADVKTTALVQEILEMKWGEACSGPFQE